MSIVTGSFGPPNVLAGEAVFKTDLQRYIYDVEQLLLSAGLVRANVINNMRHSDDHNIFLTTSTGNVLQRFTNPMVFDAVTISDSMLQIRISLEFGLVNQGALTSTVAAPVIRITSGLVNASTNDFYGSKHVYIPTTSYDSNYNSVNMRYINQGYDSVIIHTERLLFIELNPGQYVYYSTSQTAPNMAYLVIAKTEDNITVFAGDKSKSPFGPSQIYPHNIANDNKPSTPNTTIMLYDTTNSMYVQSELVLYPVMLKTNESSMVQSKDLYIVNRYALPDDKRITMMVNGMPQSFIKTHYSSNVYLPNPNVFLVRYSA